MRAPEYADFDLELSAGPAGAYVARVLASPRGEARAVVSIPVQGAELENVILRLGRTRSGVRSLGSPQAKLARSFGTQLFDAVFGGEVGTTFRRSLDDADIGGVGLRIRLRLAGVPELADIPWEYLYCNSIGRFLVLSGDTPVVRYLDMPRRVPPLPVKPPLRILLVASAPVDLGALDHKDEIARMLEVLDDLITSGSVVVEALPRPTLPALRQALRRGEYHVLHFIGHGAFDESAGDGALAFEDVHRRSHRVSGADLGTLLHDHHSLRLAVLNACEGARQSPVDPFSGVAQSLVHQGIPAVVAMQFEITDAAAVIFGQEFYASIADSYPVDAALAQARLAVFASDNDVEWGTPVLYLRARDGRIFDVAAPVESLPHTARPTPASEVDATIASSAPRSESGSVPLPSLHEEPDYSLALAAFYTERWDQAVDLLSRLSTRHPEDSGLNTRLAEARRMQEQTVWSSAASAAAERGDWDRAVAALQRLVDSDGDDPELLDRLAHTRSRQHVANLVRELKALYRAEQWNAVIAVSEQIAAIDPEAADPDGLTSLGKEQQEKAELEEWYTSGLRHLDHQDWQLAKDVFDTVQLRHPGYRESAALLARAEAEILCARGRAAQESETWDEAIRLYKEALQADGRHREARRRLNECELAASSRRAQQSQSTAPKDAPSARALSDNTPETAQGAQSAPAAVRGPPAAEQAGRLLQPSDVLNVHFASVQFQRGYEERDVDDFLDEVAAAVRLRMEAVEAKSKGRALPDMSNALTPHGVLNKHFHTTQFRRGYNEPEVDDFLDLAVDTLVRLDEYLGLEPVTPLAVEAQESARPAAPEPLDVQRAKGGYSLAIESMRNFERDTRVRLKDFWTSFSCELDEVSDDRLRTFCEESQRALEQILHECEGALLGIAAAATSDFKIPGGASKLEGRRLAELASFSRGYAENLGSWLISNRGSMADLANITGNFGAPIEDVRRLTAEHLRVQLAQYDNP